MRNDYRTEMRVVGIRRNSVSITAVPTNFNSIDCIGYRSCLFVVHIDFSGSGKSVEFTVQESDDNSNWASTGYVKSLAGADELTGIGILCDSAARKRYLRLVVTAYSATISPSCIAVLFNENITPDAAANVDVAVL